MDLIPKLEETRWKPANEKAIFEGWSAGRVFAFSPDTKKPIWTIDTPPPYATGGWHVGGAVHYSCIDMIARYKRMKGFAVNFPLGIDRNGLPVEVQTEKEFKIAMYETPREKFIGLCSQLLDKYEAQIIGLCRSLGFSMNSLDSGGIYRTDSPEYRALTQATFIELYRKGLVYLDNRPSNWCPACGTTIADAEIEYKDTESAFNYLKFKVKGENKELIIATTRPELLCACAAVLVNPDDERYKDLHGKTVLTPLYSKEVPVIPHPQASVDIGTGAVMICSYGDYTDVRLFRELGLKPVEAITPKGTLSGAAGKYEGQHVKKARVAITEDLKAGDYITKQQTVVHKTPICWRSKTPVEFVHMPEYYLKQVDYVGEMKRIAAELNFHPEQSRQILLDWTNSVTIDWPISRRRYYGTEIPLWHCKCGHTHLPEPGRYYRPWSEPAPARCAKCGGELVGETRTFDTWMDSSISELYVTGYGKDGSLFERSFPCSLRPQGKDIIRTWLFYTLLRAYQLLEKPAFEHVWISGMVMDEKGEKMSKSIGNIVKPEPLIEKYGADSLRLFGAGEATLGSDTRYSDEKLSSACKFIQKMYNISRFISAFPQPKLAGLLPSDRWIIAELNKLVLECGKGYDDFDFFVPATKIRTFAWDIFANHYVELVKARAYNRDGAYTTEEQEAAWFTLHLCLKTILKLLAPIAPFVTDYVWTKLYGGESIHILDFPEAEEPEREWLELTPDLLSANSAVWKYKREKGMSIKDGLGSASLPKNLEPFVIDLKHMHNIQQVQFSDALQLAEG